MRAWIGALLIRKRYIAHLLDRVVSLEERAHRLEIALRHFTERLETLEGSQDRLWARHKGSMGGRPPKATEDPLQSVAHGDKAGLRAHLLPVKR